MFGSLTWITLDRTLLVFSALDVNKINTYDLIIEVIGINRWKIGTNSICLWFYYPWSNNIVDLCNLTIGCRMSTYEFDMNRFFMFFSSFLSISLKRSRAKWVLRPAVRFSDLRVGAARPLRRARSRHRTPSSTVHPFGTCWELEQLIRNLF